MDLSFLDVVGGPRVVGVVVGLIISAMVVMRLLKAKPAGPKTQQLRCGQCGWQGAVSAYKPKCPKCGSSL